MIPVTHIAESYEHKELLKNKLLEEVEEFLQDGIWRSCRYIRST
ncbi:hypothetical protein [Rickettsia amblyommatis]|uniref:Uncharacterized protein n=1 Tax=Rickettsia amblyommatis (strain GAT-30V) TaxID=1105111 RepID=H8K490_RICAG|nr:hypothetical protein [Rickettsia amblyommatis]AFC69334.1 hypothetical protein MCE_01625 [Rickettsia amblyommatis str. GAT-30V]KJV97558.1 hypothetical protein RAMDARK_0369 [Rickettsia amblyommatis str. Darkwater]